MNLLLDIDGVVNNHSPQSSDKYTGFDDWTKINKKFFNRVSQEQVALIHELFGDVIRWLTTWEHLAYANPPMADEFGAHIGWPVKDSAVAQVDPVFDEVVLRSFWWKAGVVEKLLQDEHPYVQNKVLWVDDDIKDHAHQIESMLYQYKATDRFRIISPQVVWTKMSILESYDWLTS